MKMLAIAGLNLRRLFRYRPNVFFVIIGPLLFLLVLGMLFGGSQPVRIGVVDGGGPLAERLTDALAEDDRVELTRFDDHAELQTELERGLLNAGVVIPDDYDQVVGDGEQAAVRYLARADDPLAADLGVWVRSVIPQEAALLRAAQFGAQEHGAPVDQHLRAAESAAATMPGIEVAVTTTGEAQIPEGLSQFAPMAPSLLLLFVFFTSLMAALGLVEARRLGVITRMTATPTPIRTLVAGEALGRFAVALTQGLIVLLGSALLFGVDWGDPIGAAAVLVLFCLVGSGAAMLLGALFRNEGAAMGVGMGLGLGLAALGGTMLPLELLSDQVQTIAKATPHAWGYEAYSELVRHGGTVTDILPQLGALAGFAAVLFTLGAWQLQRSLTR
ncbi:ABC transporter permease [Natronosporangium hydrolyticum]|uniref:ABC transporter permease n=1 Tax=Natronosporangium hydrolyticum TaxID=2811111 RepID=A0A895Y5N8_9ACTN|nr:ABC transporter permease [Natronosporangium hydrolyticum]QSB12711.1 ABC transporter permease [Natronosporangium hydrolyticum]